MARISRIKKEINRELRTTDPPVLCLRAEHWRFRLATASLDSNFKEPADCSSIRERAPITVLDYRFAHKGQLKI